MTLQTTLDAFTTTTAPIKDRVWGAYAENGGRDGTLYELSSLDALETAVSHSFTVVSGYIDSTLETGFLTNMKTIANRGGAINVSYDLEWTFASIIAGTHDTALNAHAASFATVNGPVYLRLWAEFNGTWPTWSALYTGAGAQASGSDKYNQWKAAWQHIVTLYRNSAATNVRFIWNPNNEDDGAQVLESYWPGNSYVDVLGVDAYNFGSDGIWQTFDDIFADCYNRVTALGTAGQPVWIGEMGCREPSVAETDSTGDSDPTFVDPSHNKGTWVSQMMASTSYPRLQALCYFDVQKERHWQMSSSTSSLNAFISAFASSGTSGESTTGGTGSTGGDSGSTGGSTGSTGGGDSGSTGGSTTTLPASGGDVYVSGFNASATAPITVPSIYDFHFHTWDVVIGSNRGGNQYRLNNLSGRSLNMTLGAAASFGFDINVGDPVLPFVGELLDDVWLYCDGELLYRGRFTGSSDKTTTVHFDTLSYEALLDERGLHTRPFHPTAIFTPSWEPNGIIRWLIDHAENQTGMRLGLTYKQWLELPTLNTLYSTGVYTSDQAKVTVKDGDPIYTTINTICQLITPAVEFWIDPDLTVNLDRTRGSNNGVILDYRGVLSDFTADFSYKDFGNVIRATGSTPSASGGTETTIDIALPSYYEENGMGIPINATHTDSNAGGGDANISAAGVFTPAPYSVDPRGGWQKGVHGSHIYNQAGLDSFAKNQYDRSSDISKLRSYTGIFGAGQWRGKSHVWIGDTIKFFAQRGRLDIRGDEMRVQSLKIDIDNSGIESVTTTLNLARNHVLDLKQFKDAVTALQKKK